VNPVALHADADRGSGVNFMEKTISIRNTEITFSIWDLGGQREFVNMLPLVCNDAVAILFMFDLTRKSTLNSIKEWYRQGRGFNKTAIPFLIGTKYDHFVNFPREDQEEISLQVSLISCPRACDRCINLMCIRPRDSPKP
jgi:GTP-binding protein of the ras superfamily involved in termination of M-phase